MGGKGQGNLLGYLVEICYSKSGGDRFIKAEQNAGKIYRGWFKGSRLGN